MGKKDSSGIGEPTIAFLTSDKLIIMGDFISDASSDAEMWRKVI